MTEFLTFTSSDKNIQGTVFVRNPIPSFLRKLTAYEAKGDGGNYQNQQHSTILGLTREGKKEERTHDQKI